MIFSDDDLKRLPFQKMDMAQMKNMALDVPGLISRDDILYILARLEAAESFIKTVPDPDINGSWSSYRAWLEAGK